VEVNFGTRQAAGAGILEWGALMFPGGPVSGRTIEAQGALTSGRKTA